MFKTPPSTVRENKTLRRPVYYEDLYDKRNPEEELHPEICESEDDSEDEPPVEEVDSDEEDEVTLREGKWLPFWKELDSLAETMLPKLLSYQDKQRKHLTYVLNRDKHLRQHTSSLEHAFYLTYHISQPQR